MFTMLFPSSLTGRTPLDKNIDRIRAILLFVEVVSDEVRSVALINVEEDCWLLGVVKIGVHVYEVKVQDCPHVIGFSESLSCWRLGWGVILSHTQFIYLGILLSFIEVLSQELLQIDMMSCFLRPFYFQVLFPLPVSCQTRAGHRASRSALYYHRPRIVIIFSHEVQATLLPQTWASHASRNEHRLEHVVRNDIRGRLIFMFVGHTAPKTPG